MAPRKNGFVVALDGPDGVGKTTQVELLTSYLSQKVHTVHSTRASGGTAIGEALRQVSLANIERSGKTDLYISLAMGEALAEDIQTRKSQGQTIIIDRSPLAFVAYNGYGSRLPDKNEALKACELMVREWQIDLLIVFTVEQKVLDKRRHQRKANDYFEAKGEAYHHRVIQGYQAGLKHLQQSNIDTKIVVIQADADAETIHQLIIGTLKSFKETGQ